MSYIGQEPGLGEAERFIFTATAVTDTVTADDNGVIIGYTVGQVSVYLNGVKQVIGDDIETPMNGSSIVFASNYAIGDVIEVIALSTFSPADTVPATGGTFSGAVTFSAASQFNNAVTVGVDGTGHDFTLYGETSGKYAKWNQAADIFFLRDSTNLAFGNSTDMNLYHNGTNSYIDNSTGSLNIAVSDPGIAVNIGHTTSETTINGNLTVNGTTVTIDAEILVVEDKNIEMGSVDSPTDITADGGGIILKGTTDKTILWENDTDSWNFNQNIETSTTTKVKQKGAFMQSSVHQSLFLGG